MQHVLLQLNFIYSVSQANTTPTDQVQIGTAQVIVGLIDKTMVEMATMAEFKGLKGQTTHLQVLEPGGHF